MSIKLTVVVVSLMIISMSLGCMGHGSEKQRYLDAHNAARAEVGVEPLVWNETVAKFARSYTKKLAADCDVFEHSNNEDYGECLAEGGAIMTPEEVVQLWVDEKKNYVHGSKKWCKGGECMHYTQVVWRDTHQLGCAEAKCAKPKGNWGQVILILLLLYLSTIPLFLLGLNGCNFNPAKPKYEQILEYLGLGLGLFKH